MSFNSPILFRIKKAAIYYSIINGLVLLFTYTAFSKLLSLRQFQNLLENAPLTGGHAAAISWLLPFFELLLASALLVKRTRRAALYGSLFLLLLFTLYLLYMIVTAAHMPCPCGGVVSSMSWPVHMIVNATFTGLTAWAMRLRQAVDTKLKKTMTSTEYIHA